MNLKSKILAAGLAAIIAGFGMFAANINTVQAQTDNGDANPAIAQMMQMIETLKQQIQQIIALIAQLKPQETCGNGICRFGENNANCSADCGYSTTIADNAKAKCITTGGALAYKECNITDDNAKAKCIATGGNWIYSDCASGCTHETKYQRTVLGSRMGCGSICLKQSQCNCPTDKYLASREEGCISKTTRDCNNECDSDKTIAGCATDCGTAIEIYVWPDANSFDLVAKTFEGKILINNKKIKASVTDNIKIYQEAVWDPDWESAKHYTFAEFQSLIKNWTGPEYPFVMKGIKEKDGTIKIDEIIMKVQ